MTQFYNTREKTEICVDIAKKLKSFENSNGITVDLFNETYSFVPKLKQIFSDYIKNTQDYSGTLEFEEIDKTIHYHFHVAKPKKATFLIKMK